MKTFQRHERWKVWHGDQFYRLKLVLNDDTMIAVTYPHLTVDQSGVATITGTTAKVVEIALDRIAHH